MIAAKDILEILSAILPMYFPLTIAFISVRWFNLFTADQSDGISRFVRILAIPFLSFKVISSNNLMAINLRLFAADSLQKLLSLGALFLCRILCKNAMSLDWTITLFSLSSLPNTLIIGLPTARAMYGPDSVSLMIQTLVFQSVIWINVLLVLFEYRAAKILVFAESQRVVKFSCGDSNLVDLTGLTQIFPEKTAAAAIANFDHRQAQINGGFPAKQQLPGDGAGSAGGGGGDHDSGRLWMILEHSKEGDLRLDLDQDAPSPPPGTANGTTKLVLHMLWKKIIRNPITYSSLFGVVWSLISFKYGIKMPTLMNRCIDMLSDTGQALSMFSLGIFMAAQPNIIACSRSEAASAMVARFLVSPMLVAAISKLIGLHGIVLHTAVIQAAFPQAVLSFVLAKEYNVYPNVLSTSVVVGMLIAFPIILLYYLLLGAIFK